MPSAEVIQAAGTSEFLPLSVCKFIFLVIVDSNIVMVMVTALVRVIVSNSNSDGNSTSNSSSGYPNTEPPGRPGDSSLDGFGRVFVMQKADPLT